MYDKPAQAGFFLQHGKLFYGGGVDILFRGGTLYGIVKTFIAKVMFVLLLLLGVPSLALAHNGVTHVQPQQVTSLQEAIAYADNAKTISAEVKSVVMKTDVSAKVEKTASGTCPCGRDCGQCACFMSSCCQFINKTGALTIPVSVEGKGIFTHEILIIGMTGETLSKPPQIS